MKTPKFFKLRRKRLLIVGIIFLLFLIFSVYFAGRDESFILDFLKIFFSERVSKVLIALAPSIPILIAILNEIFGGDIREAITDEKTLETKKPPTSENLEDSQSSHKQPEQVPFSKSTFLPAPFLPDLKFFVGREDILQKIKETLAEDHKAAIHDISGLGKTFTTYKYAEDNQKAYEKIFLVRATKEEMLESLAKCGEAVNPDLISVQEQKAKADGFKQWLEENDKWLVIYDNVDLPEELFPFVPALLKGDCLFTSNFREVEMLGTHIRIEKFDKTDAEILLYTRATNRPHQTPDLKDEEKESFDNLVQEIDGLPLTLNSTGAIIYKKQLNFQKFWQRYQKTPKLVWDSEDDYSAYQRKSAGIVFSLAYNELCSAKKVGEAVRILLNSMTFLSPDEIPEDLLQDILRTQDASVKKKKDFDNFWDDVRETLTEYDLLKYSKDKELFTTHRSIQRVIQTKIKSAEKKAICKKLVALFWDLFPTSDYFNKEACEKYYLHVQTLLENTDKLQIETAQISSLFNRIGSYQEDLGNYGQAEYFYKRTLEISAKIFGIESTDYATDLNNLGEVYRLQGNYEEAVPKYEKVIEIYKKKLGNEHEWVSIALGNLGRAYQLQDKYVEAIEKLEEALQIAEKTIGKEHHIFARLLNNLANVYKNQGRYQEAVKKYNEALWIIEKTLGKKHPDYGTTLNNLGGVYRSQGRYEQAIEKYEDALRIYLKILDEGHPYTQTVKRNLKACREALKGK